MTERSNVNPSAKARVRWVLRKKGKSGGVVLPAGRQYQGVAEFEDDTSRPRGAWTLVVDLDEPARAEEWNKVTIHFLVPDAPHQLLRPGARFELYEGHVVGIGEVTG